MGNKLVDGVPRYWLVDLERKLVPMEHHKRGLQYTRSGYGGRIPTEHMVKLPGQPRWRRVYVAQWSNLGTAYVGPRGAWEAVIL